MDLGPVSIVYLISGIILCFGGWHLFKFSKYSMGIILGSSIGYFIGVSVTENLNIPIQHFWKPCIIIALVMIFSIMGMFLIKAVVRFVLFLAGFVFGFALVTIFMAGALDSARLLDVRFLLDHLSLWVFAGGILSGLLFIIFEKGFIVLYTCALGSYMIAILIKANPFFFYLMFTLGVLTQSWQSRGKSVKNMNLCSR